MDYGGSKTLNIAQPYEAYTDFRSAVDPGRDKRPPELPTMA
jgi:hypothetical protein